MNFDEMTGYDFENYISKKLEETGFKITQTSYSNDGGIDIIAYCSKPLFSGTYIIQCKKWAGNVGQPEMRDLYGVVMSERANKGILITTSDFTQQARDFAEGKNLELINGFQLARLFPDSETDMDLSEDTQNSVDPDFNYERYEYLLNKYKKKERGASVELDKFIWDTFWGGHLISCKHYKLLELAVEINTLRKKNANWSHAYMMINECNIKIFTAYLALGKFDEATNSLLEQKNFVLNVWTPREKLKYDSNSKQYYFVEPDEIYCPNACARNLYTAYKAIGYVAGMDAMLSYSPERLNRIIADHEERINSLGYYDQPELLNTHIEQEKNRFFDGFYGGYIYAASTRISNPYESYGDYVGMIINYSKKIHFADLKRVFFPDKDSRLEKKLNVVLKSHNVL